MRNYSNGPRVLALQAMGMLLDGDQMPPHLKSPAKAVPASTRDNVRILSKIAESVFGGDVIRYSSNDKPFPTFLGV